MDDGVFADWLDVTYSPEANPRDELRVYLGRLGFTCVEHSSDKEVWRPTAGSYGTIHSQLRAGSFARISASGDVLSVLRGLGQYENYIALLGSYSHRVTRLDATFDLFTDAAVVISKLLQKYPKEVYLSRQRPVRVKSMLEMRDDGLQTGTIYCGYRSRSRVTARVYDKQAEVFDKRGQVIDPMTRYEITLREGIASLDDALNPSSIFWAHASEFLRVPSGAPVWDPTSSRSSWKYIRPEVLPYSALQKRLDYCSDLDVLIRLSDDLGPEGRNVLAHLLCSRLGVVHDGHYFDRVRHELSVSTA